MGAAYHFASLQAVNEVEELRCRIEDDQPVRYDVIHLSTTIARPDGTFGFSFQRYTADFDQFVAEYVAEIQRVQVETGLKSPYSGQDIIYYTVARGIAFTSFDHPMMFQRQGSVPLMAFGEMVQDGNCRRLWYSKQVTVINMDDTNNAILHTGSRCYEVFTLSQYYATATNAVGSYSHEIIDFKNINIATSISVPTVSLPTANGWSPQEDRGVWAHDGLTVSVMGNAKSVPLQNVSP